MTTTTKKTETRTYRVTTTTGYGTRLVTLPLATAEYYARLWVDAGHQVEVVG